MVRTTQTLFYAAVAAAVLSASVFTGVATAFDHVAQQAYAAQQAQAASSQA